MTDLNTKQLNIHRRTSCTDNRSVCLALEFHPPLDFAISNAVDSHVFYRK